MNATVPEEKAPKLSPEEQLEWLRDKLAGNRAFGKCRGNFDGCPYDKFLKAGNPSKAKVAAENWFSDWRSMLHLLAISKRNGWKTAFHELEKALCNEDYVITGETVPLEQTEPGVLLMFEPEKTLLLARWMYTSTLEDAKEWILSGKINAERGQCGSLTGKLLESFPEMKQHFQCQWEKNSSRINSPVTLLEPVIDKAWRHLRKIFSATSLKWICIDPDRTEYWRSCCTLAIFIQATSQDKVLGHFSREEQKSMVTWRFDYPVSALKKMSRAWGNNPNLWIGFHPEDEHKAWSSRWPVYASRGCAAGYGAVIVDKDQLQEYPSDKTDLPEYNALSNGTHARYCTGDLMRRRIVLGFPFSPEL